MISRLIGALLFTALFAGCGRLAPATTPPQLAATPGHFVTIDDSVYDAGRFRVRYPDGWRVVKSSAAGAPPEVIFVAPDETATITLSTAPREADNATATRTITLADGSTLTATLHVTPDAGSDYSDLFERVVASVK